MPPSPPSPAPARSRRSARRGTPAGLRDERVPIRPLAHILLAAMGEAGLMIAQADDPEAERAEVEPTLVALIDGLRA
ncbi:MAG: transcriptional regulator [Thermoleophilaceae bacterium]|nr:transcriptional regulator [Thermoleophilaceae bacterium]